MTESSDHLDPKEATEAKLCAYLEGELPPNERAEIEQHLAANPQHRNLLGELAKTRDWVRDLPRESAPSDLAESFQVQVERTMLLDDDGGSASGMSIRWPQYAMVAAIVVLTLGLGVTLVIMLRGPSNRNMAIGPAPLSMPATTMPAVAGDRKSDQLTDTNPVPPVVGTINSPPPTVPTPPGLTQPAGVTPLVAMTDTLHGNDAQQRTSVVDKEKLDDVTADTLKTRLATAGYIPPSSAKSVCFVIRTDAPAAAKSQVDTFFVRHQLLAETPPGAVAAPSALASRDATTLVPGNNSGGRNSTNESTNAVTPKPEAQNIAPNLQKQLPGNADAVNPTQQVSGDNTVKATTSTAQNNGGQGVGGQLNQGPGNIAQNATAQNGGQNNGLQNSVVQNNSGQANGIQNNAGQNGAGQNIGGQNTVGSTAGQPAITPVLPAVGLEEYVYVAHHLTPLQLELLSASLATDNPNQSVKRLTLSEAPIKQLPPIAGAIIKGQSLTVTVAQLVGPGIDKTNIVKVGDDGNISLPMIDPLPAMGITIAELEQRIATKYREANLILDATVTVSTPPTTRPAQTPATQPEEKAVAATQPAVQSATTQPAPDAGIDVVVLIEKSGK